MRKKVTVAILIVAILLLAWAPWLHRDVVLEHVKIDESFIYQNRNLENDYQIHVFRIPFGYWITTLEGGWLVTFWGGILG